MAVDVYITFDGNCREALAFYEEVFDTEPAQVMTFGDSEPNPDYPMPENAKHRVMHARLHILGSTIMFSDTFPGSPFIAGNNISLAVVTDDAERIKTIYSKLKQNGQVKMELQETFWSKCYGAVTDQFGIEWQLSHEEKHPVN